jgi:hypothetical protein
LRRKISLVILFSFVALLGALNHGCSSSEGINNDESEESINFDSLEPKFKDRLSNDDGYAFAVLYGADIHGSLETCG